MRRDCRENPPNIPKVVVFLKFFFLFLGTFRERTGCEKRGGCWEAEALGFYFLLTGRQSSGP